MIEVSSLSKSFGEKKVFSSISARFPKNTTTFVLGKSGVGKSVLLKHLVGLLAPDEGKILVDEEDVTTLNEEGLTRIRKKCGMVFQFPALLDSLTVRENIAFGIYAHRMASTEAEVEERVVKMLKLVHLSESLLEKFPPTLSFGTQKRVAIARTLAIEPEYLLFDEPTTGMDPITTRMLNQLIDGLKKKLGVGAIVVSHDIESAFEVGDRLLMLSDAQVIFEGTREEFKRATHPLCQEFLREGLTHA